jgi:DNA-binding NarL/FixJ family response regulator
LTGGVARPREETSVKIIIADDQKHARSGLRALLSVSLPASEIWEARTGREAAGLADEVQPDLVLMDVRMPEMDGLCATRLIKERHPGVRIIVLSLHPAAGADALAAGADAFVSKGEGTERLLGLVTGFSPDAPRGGKAAGAPAPLAFPRRRP